MEELRTKVQERMESLRLDLEIPCMGAEYYADIEGRIDELEQVLSDIDEQTT